MVCPSNNIGQMTNLHSKHRINKCSQLSLYMTVYIKLFLDELACSFDLYGHYFQKRSSSTEKKTSNNCSQLFLSTLLPETLFV